MGQPAHLEKITSVKRRGCPTQRSQAFKIPIISSFNKSDNGDHTNPQGSNELGPLKALIGPKTFVRPVAPARPLQALSPTFQSPDANQYSQQNLDKIIQTFFYSSKCGSLGNKLKAKTLNVYCNRFHIECYNFCQQYKDHFAIAGATGPYQIPFAAFFLQD